MGLPAAYADDVETCWRIAAAIGTASSRPRPWLEHCCGRMSTAARGLRVRREEELLLRTWSLAGTISSGATWRAEIKSIPTEGAKYAAGINTMAKGTIPNSVNVVKKVSINSENFKCVVLSSRPKPY